MKKTTRLLAAAAACLFAAQAHAAVTYDVQGGKLVAIRGLPGNVASSDDDDRPYVIRGIEYRNFTDVEFLDGSCTTVLQVCNDNTFSATARRANSYVRQYLADGVLVDGRIYNFNSDPTLTNGCSDQATCNIYVGVFDPGLEYSRISLLENFAGPTTQQSFIEETNVDTTSRSNATFARVTSYTTQRSIAAVPEPATWALMLAGFGLTGAALRRRRVRFAGVAA